MKTAKQWLKSTFLSVRLNKNPRFYQLDGRTQAINLEQQLDEVYEKGIANLVKEDMVVNNDGKLTLTKFGEAMSRYYVRMGTMHSILKLPPRSPLQDVVTVLDRTIYWALY